MIKLRALNQAQDKLPVLARSQSLHRFEGGHVQQVLRPPTTFLLRINSTLPIIQPSTSPKVYPKPGGPRLVKLHSINGHEDIDTDRRHADLVDHPRSGEILNANSVQRGTKISQSPIDPRSVCRFGPYPHIEVLCVAGLAVVHDCVAADNQVLSSRAV